MTPRKPKVDVTLVEAKDASEAMNLIFAGVKYFLIKNTMKTLIVLMLMAVGPVYVAWDYFTSQKVRVEEISPIGESLTEPTATYAVWSEDKTPIVIDGKLYGYEHPDWRVRVFEDGRAMIVYNLHTKRVFKMGADFLDEQATKK